MAKPGKRLVDKSKNKTDVPHDYVELKTPAKARYLKITNLHMPTGKFALSGFRVFGKGQVQRLIRCATSSYCVAMPNAVTPGSAGDKRMGR
jgi:hypothetical protein